MFCAGHTLTISSALAGRRVQSLFLLGFKLLLFLLIDAAAVVFLFSAFPSSSFSSSPQSGVELQFSTDPKNFIRYIASKGSKPNPRSMCAVVLRRHSSWSPC